MDVSEACNLACIHCAHPTFKKSEHYAGRFLPVELNQKLVDEVRESGNGACGFIRYSGSGEPLMNPKGYEIVEYGVKNSGVYVTLTTNGTIMNEAGTRRLLEAGVNLIDISIDAHDPQTYAVVRQQGNLDITRSNVLRLIKWARETRSRTRVVVTFIEQPENAHEAVAFERYWKDQGADSVVIRRLHSNAGAVVRIAEVLRKTEAASNRRPCVYPWERVVLDARGTISFCPGDWVHGSTVADYRTTTIKEIWQGRFYESLRNAHLTNDYRSHAFCGQCPDWQQTRWPTEGRGFADLIADFNQESG